MYPHRRCGHKYAAEVGQISAIGHSPPTETRPPPALARAPPLDRGRARVREEIGEILTASRDGRGRYIRVRLTETELNKVRAKAELAGLTVSDFIREAAIYGKQEFTLSKLPGGECVDVKEALEGLLDTEHRTVQKHFNAPLRSAPLAPFADRGSRRPAPLRGAHLRPLHERNSHGHLPSEPPRPGQNRPRGHKPKH